MAVVTKGEWVENLEVSLALMEEKTIATSRRFETSVSNLETGTLVTNFATRVHLTLDCQVSGRGKGVWVIVMSAKT